MTSESLLNKYNIPIANLDFDYINNCSNIKEIEKIVKILRSGQEGYFPDLTKCAEQKLESLNPNSRHLRVEEPVLTIQTTNPNEWKDLNDPIIDWTRQIQYKGKVIATVSDLEEEIFNFPPIRQADVKIEINKNIEDTKKNPQKIKSTDYTSWDKYDADTEVLKIDLQEEKIRQDVEQINEVKLKKAEEYLKGTNFEKDDLKKLTEDEKEMFSIRYKERGNEYYRSGDYLEAVFEYTRCINMLPSASGYNNRAMAHLKLKNYQKTVEDCDRCLHMESTNIKALHRKGQALLGLVKPQEAYDIYSKIISIEPSNKIAREHVNTLKKQLGDSIPKTATRIQIAEKESDKKEDQSYIETDLSKLIIPNKIIKSQMKTTMESIGKLCKKDENIVKKADKIKPDKKNEEKIKILSSEIVAKPKKILIEEI